MRISTLWLVGSLCLLASAACLAQGKPSTAGRSVHVLTPPLAMPGLDRQRTLRVYLPPGYASGSRRYPVLYMHDGQNLFDDATSFVGEWGIDESMDDLAKTDGIEVIVVGIDHGDAKRVNELLPWPNEKIGKAEGAQYMQFLVDTVKPYIDARFRTLPAREHTGIMGSSLGGLTSHYAFLQYPKVFSKVGIYSPSYWVSDEVYRFTAGKTLPADVRIVLVAGDKEGGDTSAKVLAMDRQLRAIGDKSLALHTAIIPGGEHNEKFWRSQFQQSIRYLFGAGEAAATPK